MSVQTPKAARLELRLSVQEREIIEGKAKAFGMSLSDYIRTMALAGPPVEGASEVNEHLPAEVVNYYDGRKPQNEVRVVLDPLPYRCPDSRCDKQFGSPAVTCPIHGRKAVPVA